MKKLLTIFCICMLAIATTLTACNFIPSDPAVEPQVFTITFADHDGSVIETIEVTENQEIVYPGTNPSRAADAQYTYQFIGWANAEGTVLAQLPYATEDATFTAYYNKTVNSYTVEFKNGDEVLQTETLEYGAQVSFSGDLPTSDANAQYSYVFSGWTDGENNYAIDETLPTVTGDVSYQAIFSSTLNSYEITWNVLGEKTTASFKYGEVATFVGTPEKESTVQYSYSFVGWARTEDGEVLTAEQMTVVAADEYFAVFSATVNEYPVTFVDEKGNVLSSVNVAYGTSPEFNGELPKLENNAQYTYEYLGWIVGDAIYSFADTLPRVTGEITYTLKLETTVNEYTVTWVVEGETTQKVLAYGATPEYKGTPAKEGTSEYEYQFMGWALNENGEVVEIATVTADATYYAVFKAVKNQYEIKFVDAEGNELHKATLDYGDAVSYAGAALPEKEATAKYSYIPVWQAGEATYELNELPAVSGAATYTLAYREVINKYTITINYEVVGGAAPATKTITLDYGTPYGKAETESPAVEGYAPNYYWLAGVLTEDVTYTVKYNAVDVWDGTIATAFESGSGTEKDPYIIKTGAQLAYLAKLGMDNTAAKESVYGTGIYYKLGASLDLSQHQWTPIAFREDPTSTDWTYFDGNFDGAGYTIKMYIYTEANKGYGLFQGLGATAVVKDLTLAGSITCTDRAGAISYINQNGTFIENIINYTDIITTGTGNCYVGGLVGSSGASKITNCVNYGNVSAAGSIVGGIVGKASKNAVLENCENYGTVSTTATKCAGIAGETETATIFKCTNYGTIISKGTAGGFGGNVTSSTIISLCTNYGEINGTGSQTAGIAAYAGAGCQILGCVNYGAVTNTAGTTGGIMGTNKGYVGDYVAENGTIYHTINYGSVSGARYVGGISGCNETASKTVRCTVENAINYGHITGTGEVGGIVGIHKTGKSSGVYYELLATVKNSVNYGNVDGKQYTGGIVGQTDKSIVDGSTNYGQVVGTSAVGGINGQNASSSTTQNSTNYGDVIGAGENVGGISGYVGGGSSILECTNHGNVTNSSNDTGGIVGENKGAVENVENHGDISSTGSYTGGCIGRNIGGDTHYLTNHGDVTALRAEEGAGTGIGGVIGSNQDSSVASNLTNYGTVIGYVQVGGISGYQGAGSSIDVAVNNGKVYGYTGQVGQIVGYNNAPDETTNVTENGSAEIVTETEDEEE